MAMRLSEFSLVVSAERKIEKGEELTQEEKAAIKKHGITSKKICSCGCGKSMEPRVDGEHHQIDGKSVNSDCYFEKFGAEIDLHPIYSPVKYPLGASFAEDYNPYFPMDPRGNYARRNHFFHRSPHNRYR